MPRKLIKRYLPDSKKITEHKVLRLLGPVLFDPLLWHLHRRNVAKAVAIGVFFGFMPVPVQMLLAAICAILFRANLPLSVALVWISNPITIAPMFIFAYKVGTWFLGKPIQTVKFTASFTWLMHELAVIWKPLFLGAFICGGIAATIGYFLTSWLWRWWVVYHWGKRKKR